MKIRSRKNSPLFVSTLALLFASPLLPNSAEAASTYTIAHSFSGGSVAHDGASLLSSLILGSDGNFYGTSLSGGSAGSGTVFKMTPAGIVTILHSFADGTVANDGKQAYAGLIQGPDNTLYGTTYIGGSGNAGIVYRISPDGSNYSILHAFADGSVANDGQHPYLGHLTLGLDGNLYGTTLVGGNGSGIAFTIAPDGSSYQVLHIFNAIANDASSPSGALIPDTNGNFYGVGQFGGSAGSGAVFKMTSAGIVTILHSFGDGSTPNDGQTPFAGLTLGLDGNYYGTTSLGGSANKGTVFEMTPAGNATTLHSFEDGGNVNDGGLPRGGLALGPSGKLYGATFNGGSANKGTVYSISPAGSFTVLHTFGDGSTQNDGTVAYASPIAGPNGYFYGTTSAGGSASSGTVYSFLPEQFLLSAPSSSTAGSPFNVTVTAVDDSGSTVTDYNGTVHFTSDDPTANLPADTTLTSGTGSFSTTLYSAATKTIRARDTADATTTATTSVIVNAAALDHFTFTTPNSVTAGTAFYATLSALDAYNNVVKSFTDTIHLSSTDTAAVLPANFVLTGGAKQLIIKLQMPGTQTITATDTNNCVAVTSGNINVGTVASKYLITGPATSTVGTVNTYTITAKDNVGNTATSYTGTVHFTTTDPNATVPGDITLVNGTGTFQITFQTKGAQKVNAADTVNAAVKGLASTTVK